MEIRKRNSGFVETGWSVSGCSYWRTANASIKLLRQGGRLCSVTSDAPAGDGTQLSTNLYVRPDAGQLGILAAAVAAGTLHLAASPVELADAPSVARRLANGQAAGTAYVITP